MLTPSSDTILEPLCSEIPSGLPNVRTLPRHRNLSFRTGAKTVRSGQHASGGRASARCTRPVDLPERHLRVVAWARTRSRTLRRHRRPRRHPGHFLAAQGHSPIALPRQPRVRSEGALGTAISIERARILARECWISVSLPPPTARNLAAARSFSLSCET